MAILPFYRVPRVAWCIGVRVARAARCIEARADRPRTPPQLRSCRVPPKAVYRGTLQGSAALLGRSEEHTSELQSLMRISYAVFCLKKNKQKAQQSHIRN